MALQPAKEAEVPTTQTKYYRKATKDYSSRLGDRELYRRYFREAYETGFNDGFNPQTPSYDNNRNRIGTA